MDSLLALFPSQNALIDHIIEETWFIKKDVVISQVNKTMNLPKIPVRYSSGKNAYSVPNTGKSSIRQMSINSIVNYNAINPQPFVPNVPIIIDYDGNKAVRDDIEVYTGHRVSQGSRNTILYHTIAHIWGQTAHPYYFDMFWNICLIPNHVAWITDKNVSSGIPYNLIELLKAISWLLYNPNKLMPLSVVSQPNQLFINWAQNLLKYSKINYIP